MGRDESQLRWTRSKAVAPTLAHALLGSGRSRALSVTDHAWKSVAATGKLSPARTDRGGQHSTLQITFGRLRWRSLKEGPAASRTFFSSISAAGSWRGPGHFACLRSGSAAEHSSNAPCPLRDRPCRAVRLRHGATLPRFREVQRPCCDRYSPCQVPWCGSQRPTTRGAQPRSSMSRDGEAEAE